MSVIKRVINEELKRAPAPRNFRAPNRKPRGPRRKKGRAGYRGIYIQGHKQLDKALKEFVPELRDQALHDGAKRAAEIVAKAAKERAPVGDYVTGGYFYKDRDPGELKENIGVTKLTPKRHGRIGYAVTVGGKSLHVGDQFYAGFVEMGWWHTGSVRKAFAKTRRWIPGQGFLRSALYDNRKKVIGAFVYEVVHKWGYIVDKTHKKSGGVVT